MVKGFFHREKPRPDTCSHQDSPMGEDKDFAHGGVFVFHACFLDFCTEVIEERGYSEDLGMEALSPRRSFVEIVGIPPLQLRVRYGIKPLELPCSEVELHQSIIPQGIRVTTGFG
jgi:hypothetical protein